jgi:hypothetical protein
MITPEELPGYVTEEQYKEYIALLKGGMDEDDAIYQAWGYKDRVTWDGETIGLLPATQKNSLFSPPKEKG